MSDKNYFIWVDERTSDFTLNDCEFQPAIEALNCELLICGDSGVDGNLQRGRECINNLKLCLDEIVKTKRKTPSGFILDVNIPVTNLEGISSKLSSIDTYKGSYTGFLLAQYVLRNNDGNLSPYRDYFSTSPVLYLSVHQFQKNDFTTWMGSEYTELDKQSSNCSKYTHLEKNFTENEMKGSIATWVRQVLKD